MLLPSIFPERARMGLLLPLLDHLFRPRVMVKWALSHLHYPTASTPPLGLFSRTVAGAHHNQETLQPQKTLLIRFLPIRSLHQGLKFVRIYLLSLDNHSQRQFRLKSSDLETNTNIWISTGTPLQSHMSNLHHASASLPTQPPEPTALPAPQQMNSTDHQCQPLPCQLHPNNSSPNHHPRS